MEKTCRRLERRNGRLILGRSGDPAHRQEFDEAFDPLLPSDEPPLEVFAPELSPLDALPPDAVPSEAEPSDPGDSPDDDDDFDSELLLLRA